MPPAARAGDGARIGDRAPDGRPLLVNADVGVIDLAACRVDDRTGHGRKSDPELPATQTPTWLVIVPEFVIEPLRTAPAF